MTARDKAIAAAARAVDALWGGRYAPNEVEELAEEMTAALAAALPVLLNDLADRIEREKHSGWVGDETLNDGINKAIRLVRAAAEGWGTE